MSKANERINQALSKHAYTQIRKVGEGSFGAAILVQHSSDKASDTKAIVKMIDISRASKQEKEDAVKESQVLSSLKHPYIVRYRESFHEDGWLCIVMDYCEGGDLADRIKKMRQSGKSCPEEQVLRWFTQAILALKYIHDMHIMHRDLKSGNFFLSKSGNIKVGDFGIAKVLECTAAHAQTQIGTPYYLSPEICLGKPYAWSSDIWSMGCILYEMCARKVPFDAGELRSLIQKITKGPAPEVPPEYSAGLRKLCHDLLNRDPAARPSAAAILKVPVVQEVVRRMLEEVKGDDSEKKDAGGGASRPAASGGASAAPTQSATADGAGGASGGYERNQKVEYYSETHGEWLPAVVTNVHEDGRIMLNVKPNVWLNKEVQSAKVRPKGAPAAAAPSASGGRPPAQPGSYSGAPAQSPSGGARRPRPDSHGGPMQRAPSRDGGLAHGSGSGPRAPSPRRDALPAAGQRAPSQDRHGSAAARQRTPQRQASPMARGPSEGRR
eukprot:TRINITY_DN92875_c0_g1_i1.p1 TRINITY_DN92875_c0_g1~~TRINITY_DN92875_c0_g1_i1.p1  ORF type:complete len:496 (-),score=97.27 TRINITY_DN92875_c0_g1_i1:156-1643(-)